MKALRGNFIELTAAALEPLEEPPVPQRPTDTDRIRSVFRTQPGRWFAAADLAALTNLTISRLNGCLYSLITAGQVERQLPPADGRRKLGQRYRWSGS